MLTHPTPNDRNFLNSEWIYKNKASLVWWKKNIYINTMFLQTRQKNNVNVLTGRSSVAEDRFQRPQETKIRTMQSCMMGKVKGQCCDSFGGITLYRAWLSYTGTYKNPSNSLSLSLSLSLSPSHGLYLCISPISAVCFVPLSASKDAQFEHASMLVNLALWYTKHSAKVAASTT